MTIDLLALMTGIDIPLPELGLILHQPTIKEISYIGEEIFFRDIALITIDKQSYRNELSENDMQRINNFILFSQVIMTDETSKQPEHFKSSVIKTLNLFFPDYKIFIYERTVIFNQGTENFIINEENFENFQQIIAQVCNISKSSKDNASFNPANEKAAEIAKKLQKARERLQKQKEKSSVISQYLSSLSVGLREPLETFSQMTLFQLYDIVERYSLYTSWDLDIRSRLAGGSSDEQPVDWMKSIHT